MLKSPTAVFNHFITALKEEKELKFNMNYWFHIPDNYTPMNPKGVTNVCGTSACIAGTVAFRLDPQSTESAVVSVMAWVGLKTDDKWGGLAPTSSTEEMECDRALDILFTNAFVYICGDDDLDTVTKEQVITFLTGLVKEGHHTWESVRQSIESTVEDNEY